MLGLNLLVLTSQPATFGEVELSPGCALALAWPGQVLRDFEREDLAMIGFQIWLLVMSIVAVSPCPFSARQSVAHSSMDRF